MYTTTLLLFFSVLTKKKMKMNKDNINFNNDSNTNKNMSFINKINQLIFPYEQVASATAEYTP